MNNNQLVISPDNNTMEHRRGTINKKIILNPAVVARALGVIVFVLVVASVGGQLAKYLWGHPRLFGLVRLFDVDSEQNIPTLFSVFLLLFAASLLAIITLFKNRQRDIDMSKWAVLSLGFLLMAVDEATSIHETLEAPVRGLLGMGWENLGFFRFTWVIAGIAIVLALALYFLGFLLRLPAKTRFFFMGAATIFVGGAIGFDMIEGRYYELHELNLTGLNLTYSMMTAVEETLEMVGVIVFIYALLKYIDDNYREVQFGFDDSEANRNRRTSET